MVRAIVPLTGSACSESWSPSESSSAVEAAPAIVCWPSVPGATRCTLPDGCGQAPRRRFGEFLAEPQTWTGHPRHEPVTPDLRLALEVRIEATCGRPPSLSSCAWGRGPHSQQRIRSLLGFHGHCQSHFQSSPGAGVGESGDSFARALGAQAKRPAEEEDIALPPTAQRSRLRSEDLRETGLRKPELGGVSGGPCPGTRYRQGQERRQCRLERNTPFFLRNRPHPVRNRPETVCQPLPNSRGSDALSEPRPLGSVGRSRLGVDQRPKRRSGAAITDG